MTKQEIEIEKLGMMIDAVLAMSAACMGKQFSADAVIAFFNAFEEEKAGQYKSKEAAETMLSIRASVLSFCDAEAKEKK